jgi:deoxyribodipyrimidine photolyase
VAVKASGPGSEDNGLNWLVFELLWRDFFRCTFHALKSLALFRSFLPN